MPRQSRGPTSAPRRPTASAAPARPAPTPQQTRAASTVAQPPAQTHAAAPPAPVAQAPAASQGPGLFGQMASTAAGVAVGSSIGHAIGGFFGGGSSSAPAPAVETSPLAETQSASSQNLSTSQQPAVCATDVNNFRQCMDQNQGNLTICGWYLDQLKACQAAANPY
ncbi:Hypothetical protein R9X50_00368600 [Acrodontium crateriforme]|uniref:CHCH domain protein n=1 Tax=Acrodontium crateriforme TaxID=150365 RepID=A0AAQ3RA32_9PEZI|nr:Hypothetical protein R9X50_00368600 [Acrodontium crateriforme]